MQLSSAVTSSSGPALPLFNRTVSMARLTIRAVGFLECGGACARQGPPASSRVTSVSLCFEKFIRGKQIILQTTAAPKDTTACSCLM